MTSDPFYLIDGFYKHSKGDIEGAAPSREGGGFRRPILVSRCPKPRLSRGEAVGPAPVGVQPQAGVRSPPKVCESDHYRMHTWGPFLPPPGAYVLGVGLSSFLAQKRIKKGNAANPHGCWVVLSNHVPSKLRRPNLKAQKRLDFEP
jgi:hypothetical protein